MDTPVDRPRLSDSSVRQIQIFLSSPTDVLPEREIAERVIARLDGIWGAHVRLRAERWERRHYHAGKSFQETIGSVAEYDLVIGILWKRIGSPLPPDLFHRADGSQYESGTAFEIESAIATSERADRPQVYLFRKTEAVHFPAATVDEDRRQYAALLAWWDRMMRPGGHFRRGYQQFHDSEDFEPNFESLLENYLREARLIPAGAAWDIATQGSPFPGLVPYDSRYRNVFFGRALATANALEELEIAAGRGSPFLLVVGPSGSGKSSLVGAGLIPHFAGPHIAGIDFWRRVQIEPAEDPIRTFAERLYAAEGLPELAGGPQPNPETFAAVARQSPEAAAQAVKWGLEQAAVAQQREVGGGRMPTGRLLVVLDQLETLFDNPQRSVLARIAQALITNETGWIVATLRSDRYGDLQLDPDFVELRRRSALFDLPPPGKSEIADIIKGPARSAGLSFEERDGVSLAKVIAAQVSGADALPLLQMTLAQLFAARRGTTLTYEAYEAIGGLEGAIAAHATAVFARIAEPAQATLDALLRTLVIDIDHEGRLTIAAPDRARIIANGVDPELLDKMIEARLLVNAEGAIRIAHEALLRRWRRAAESPALQPEAIRLRRQIEPHYLVWFKTRLDTDLLQQNTTLAAAEEIVAKHPTAFPTPLADYVRRSAAAAVARLRAEELRAQREAKRQRRRAYIASAAAVVFAALTILVFRLYGDANHDFLLALLTRTDNYLIDGEPAHALVMSGSLSEASFLDRPLAAMGLLDLKSDEAVRLRTIRDIAKPAASAPLRTLFRDNPANAAAFSPDGAKFAIGYADGEIVVGATDRHGKDIYLDSHAGRIWALTFAADGRSLASASTKKIMLWKLADGGRGTTLAGPGPEFTDVAFDPSGRYLAWSSRDGRVTVRDMTDGTSRFFADQHRAALALDFSRDGRLLASSGDDGVVVVRRTADWKVEATIRTGARDLISIAFNGDGSQIATASLAGPVAVWTLGASGAPTAQTVPARPQKRWQVRYSAGGSMLAIASWDGTISFWDAHTLQYRGTIDGNDERVNGIAFGKAHTLLSADESGAVRFWNAAAVAPIFMDTPNDSRETLTGRYSPDGSKFVAGGKDGLATVYRVNDDGSFTRICAVKHQNWVTSVAFSPDGKSLLSGDRDAGGVTLSDSSTCRQIGAPIKAGSAADRAVAFSPAGNRIAWSGLDGAIWLQRLGDPAPVELPHVDTSAVPEIDFSPDGKLLVSGSTDGKVLLWDVNKAALLRSLADKGPAIYTVRFAANGKLVAAGGVEDRIQVWDISRPKGKELIEQLPALGGANRLAFSRDGSILALGSDARYISMWSTSNWQKIFQLNAMVGVRSVFDFRPGSGDLAFDGEHGVIRVLRHRSSPAAVASGIRQGMDVFFDKLPANFGPP
jgi:WD40 repeat protein/energy-coupling factor transporter ATP-binding protein EcfA2